MQSTWRCAIGTAVCAVALAAAGAAAAQDKLPAGTKVDPGSPQAGFGPTAYAEPAADFLNDVRELDAAQVRLAQVAERKASPPVKAFAKQVRLEFSGGRASLKGQSNDQGVPLVGSKALRREHATLVGQLDAPHADVDRLFVDYEVLVLQEALGLVQPYATGGVEARLRQASAEAVSADDMLLSSARALQR